MALSFPFFCGTALPEFSPCRIYSGIPKKNLRGLTCVQECVKNLMVKIPIVFKPDGLLLSAPDKSGQAIKQKVSKEFKAKTKSHARATFLPDLFRHP